MSGAPLRVGLLQCDHVGKRFATITPDYDVLFRTMLAAADADADADAGAGASGSGRTGVEVIRPIELVVYDAVHGEVPAAIDGCDAWLITGSRFSAYDDELWIHELEAFLRAVHERARPMVGVCFGHQLLAQALGGRVERAPTGWGVGVHRTALVDGPAWDLYYMHQDQVVAPPPGAEVLASTEHCPVAMFALGANAFGLQAHPEFTAAYLEALLHDRVLRIGESMVAAGVASLATPTQSAAAAAHLAGILRGADPRDPPH